ncbi:MAG: Cytidylate kinase [Candidatus Kaiserbacteria bacterium GW2011_GWC2_52_8b]|uniref:(d)CMP kinase n=2 Tax=Candidatus Kaiseribacteriota TaxID=1752734 RepID=A0A0G1XFA8_9BACT|nr:MAG: Cytidylate kinase [Candidatus Kaiserbacteria bacterium GW2011_GWA2_52_12]KKW29601.1 MAG: Cytidylate kinase [Candidatus Kaiserbacteria bacterium GW2011_GWC2_52_8b]
MKKHIITIGGLPGSGKSSTAKGVASMLGYQHFSSGDFWREVAIERGLTMAELSKTAENDPSIDKMIDDTVRNAGAKSDIVIDSRLAFHWIPDAFKVFLHIDPHTASQRIFEQMQKVGRVNETAESVEQAYNTTLERVQSESKRYHELYGVSYIDESQYDLVVDTTRHPLVEVVQIITETYKKWLEN